MPVYFIQEGAADGPIKIGTTGGDPLERLAKLRTGNPRPLTLLVSIPGGAKEERELHTKFAPLRMEGEWFRADPILIGFVEACRHFHGRPKIATAPPNEREDYSGRPGLFAQDLRYVVAFMHADALRMRVREFLSSIGVVDRAGDSGVLEPDDIADAVYLLDKIETALASGDAGAIVLGGIDTELFWQRDTLRDIIVRHHASIADLRAVADFRDGIDPTLAAVEVGPDPWGDEPLSNDPPTPAVH
jgi:hypothetical protein